MPKGLCGTLYRCGPGPLTRGGHKLAHVFDGDGRVDRVSFSNGKASAMSTYVETEDFLAEAHADHPLVRGAFGTSAGAFPPLRRKNTANTAVIMHAGALLALWEGGRPHELDPDTLQTYGEHTLGGIALPGMPFTCGSAAVDGIMGGGGHGISAHPKRMPDGTLVTLMSQWTGLETHLTFTTHARGSFKPLNTTRIVHPGITHIHDFTVSGGSVPQVIFVAPPIDFDAVGFALGKSIAHCVSSGREASVLYVAGCASHAQFPMHNLLVSHIANAFVSATGKHIIDCISYASCRPPRLCRLIADSRTGTLEEGTLFDEPAEFPTINPQFQGHHHRYVYVTTEQGWTRIDTNTLGRATATCPGGGLHLEAVFVPSSAPSELDGWLVGFCLQGKANTLCIVCARTMIIACTLDASVCNRLGLHGHFCRA